MSRKTRQRLTGSLTAFLFLAIVFIVGFGSIARNTSIRGGGYHNHEEEIAIHTIVIIVATSFLSPVLLWSNGFKDHAKGAIWGILLFYLVLIFLISTLIY